MNGFLLHEVVVGLDGSAQSLIALEWAASEVAPGGRIHAVNVVLPLAQLAVDAALGDSVAVLRRHEQELTDVWLAPIAERAADRDIKIMPVVREGTVAATLRAVAEEEAADAIVVGHHPHARFGPQLVGHVASDLLRRSRRPVVVVPDSWRSTPDDRRRSVVVGVGVAAGTRTAIRWALEHRTESGVSLVHAFGPRSLFRRDGVLDVVAYHLDPDVLPHWVEDDLTALAESIRAETGAGSDLVVDVEVEHGRTGPVLVAAGDRARALVIGRGEPAFVRRHVIAPYLSYALAYAACPVIVVPVGSHRRDDD